MQQHTTTPTQPTTTSVPPTTPEYRLVVTKQQTGGYKWTLTAGVGDRTYGGWAQHQSTAMWDAVACANEHHIRVPAITDQMLPVLAAEVD